MYLYASLKKRGCIGRGKPVRHRRYDSILTCSQLCQDLAPLTTVGNLVGGNSLFQTIL